MASTMLARPRLSVEVSAEREGVLSWSLAIREFLDYLHRRGYSRLTLRDYQVDIAQISTFVGGRPQDLTDPDFESVAISLHDLGFGDAVIRRKRAAHHAFVGFLRARGSTRRVAAEAWTAAVHEPAADRVLLLLIMAAGVRLHEAPAIEGRDVRLRAGTILIRAGQRIVPLHPELRALLGEVRNEVPLVPFRPLLPGVNGFSVNARTMHARFRRLMNRLGHPDLCADALRRDVASELLGRGTPSGLVSAFLGRDRGKPIAPRRGHLVDLTCMEPRLSVIRFGTPPAAGPE